MKKRFAVLVPALILIALLAVGLTQAQAPDPRLDPTPTQVAIDRAPFTYQGYLTDAAGQPISATCALNLGLYDGSGVSLGVSQSSTVTVAGGYFSVLVNFPAAYYNGSARALETEVKCSDDAGYTTLPLQAINLVPYAQHSVSTGALQGWPLDSAAPSAGQVLKWNGSTWSPAGDDVSVVVSGTTIYAGEGLYPVSSGNNITLNVSYAGTGSTATAARSDHDHDLRYSILGHTHPGSDITSAVAQATNADLLDGQQGTYYQARVGGTCSAGSAIRVIGADGSVTCEDVTTAITATYATTATYAADADTLDGQHASAFAAVNHSHDHGALTGLLDDDHPQYVSTSVARTITAVHTFDPVLHGPPFTIGWMAIGQLVPGLNCDLLEGHAPNNTNGNIPLNDGTLSNNLNADMLDGLHASAFATSSHTHAGEDITSGTVADARIAASLARDNEIMPIVLAADGSGSTLDADLLDGNHSSAFATANHNHDASYWKLAGNTGTTPGTNFLGTTDNQALEFKVNGLRVLRLEPNATSPNVIGGYSSNSVFAGVRGAVIGGGGYSFGPNNVTDYYGVIGGGGGNTVGDNDADASDMPYAVVGGGISNAASAGYATIGGGQSNVVNSANGVIAGGASNTVGGINGAIGGGWSNTISSGGYSVIGGGGSNVIAADYGTIPGGMSNSVAGAYSFAAGQRAHANHTGSFVWGDSSTADVASTGNNQFIVRAQQVWFGLNSAPSWPANAYLATSTGAYLTTGGTWTNSSDKNAKENLAQVNGREMLDRLAGVPVTTWNYKAENPTIRHIGPMAQDFYAAFNVGQDNKHISTVDADGVALASAQALYQIVQDQGEQIDELKTQNADLEARLAKLEQRNGGASPLSSWGLLGLGLVAMAGVVVMRRGKLP